MILDQEIIVSTSWGNDSVALVQLLHERGFTNVTCVYCDTGWAASWWPGMSWENRSEWELDHKHPLSRFDLSDPAQRARACHYTNIQPLWRSDNRRKGAKCL